MSLNIRTDDIEFSGGISSVSQRKEAVRQAVQYLSQLDSATVDRIRITVHIERKP